MTANGPARVRIVADQLRRPVPGGIGTYIEGLVRGLREVGAPDISLWASRPPKADRLADLGFPIVNSVFPSRVLTRMWDNGIGGDTPSGVDIIHATSFAIPPTSLPLVVTVHDTAWREFPEAYPAHGLAWHEKGLQKTLAKAAAIVTPSPQVAEDLVLGGFRANAMFVVDEGVDHLAAPDAVGADDLLKQHGIDSGFLLAVGTLEPRKNLPRLIEAYAAMRPLLPRPLPLVLVGPSGWGEQIAPTEGVVMVGKVDNAVLSSLYEKCHVFVSVPLTEGFGLPAVEAMAMGAPVVSSPVPSINTAALQVSPTDVDAIAAAMLLVSTDVAARQQLVQQSRERAAQLTWKTVALEHLAIWERVQAGDTRG